jgi:hypothetical protein
MSNDLDPQRSEAWLTTLRAPVVITVEDAPAVERQWVRFAAMSQVERVELGMRMSEVALRQRRERLQRRFPHADARGISWAVVREILELEPGIDPVPR